MSNDFEKYEVIVSKESRELAEKLVKMTLGDRAREVLLNREKFSAKDIPEIIRKRNFVDTFKVAILMVIAVNSTGCAVRCSVTPVQAEEFTQKTVTNQFFDWMFNSNKEGK